MYSFKQKLYKMDICLVNMYEIPESWFWKRISHFMAVAGALK